MRWFVCTLLYLSYVFARHEEYDGHALFSVKTQNVEQAVFFNNLEYPLDIWQYAAEGREGIILVPKKHVQQFQEELYSNEIEFNIEIENIKESDLDYDIYHNQVQSNFGHDPISFLELGKSNIIKSEEFLAHFSPLCPEQRYTSLEAEDQLRTEKMRKKAMRSNEFDGPLLTFDDIYNLTQVNNYLEKIAEAYPDVVTLVNGGKSFEGRDVNYLKISNTKFENTSKPIIFVETLLHSREWVTLPASLYAIDKLVVNVTEQDLIDDYDWIILPVANPDGYEYSHTTDRLWRKNRRTGLLPNDTCSGVDLNRNFDIFYGLGSSNSVCHETYHGTGPFSEPETSIIRDILYEYEGRIELFLDIHSFGSMILYGWGSSELPPNVFHLHAGGLQMAEAIDAVKREYNRNYIVGNAALVLYHASGVAMDYATVTGVPLSYAYELPRHKDHTSIWGFLVHPDFIEQAGMETWEGIKTGARFARSIMSPRN